MKKWLSVVLSVFMVALIVALCINCNLNKTDSGEESSSIESSASESLTESGESTSQTDSDSESESNSESISESVSESVTNTFVITLNYNGFDDNKQNVIKTISVKKGEAIDGLPIAHTGVSTKEFEYWEYNGKKISNGMIFEYDSDITIVAHYATYSLNY